MFSSPRVVCVGEGLVVLVAEPGALEDSASFSRSAGGAESNVARVLTQLDVSAAWVSRVGDDGFGRYILRQLDAAGVDVSGVTVDRSRSTGMYVKERGAGTGAAHDLALGESRMTYFRSGSAASALCAGDLPVELIRRAQIVHFSGITVALSESAESTTRSLLAGDSVVSFDLNFRPALWGNRIGEAPAVLAEHVRGSDIVLMGADEAEAVFGIGDAASLRAEFPEPRHLVVKNDAHVVTAFDGSSRVDVPALTVDVVERIGAGDAFAGGFLAGLSKDISAVECVRLGHLCAAGALTAHGDVAKVLSSSSRNAALGLSDDEWSRVMFSDLVSV